MGILTPLKVDSRQYIIQGMRKDREQAVVLRKSGMSYSDIKSRMGVPRSTLSKWFRDQKWSNDIATDCANRARNNGAIRFAVLNTVRQNRLGSLRKEARQDAMLDFEDLKYHPLFISGVIAYWMHGDMKSRNRVCFSSADPDKVSLFRVFLVRICGIERPKVWISLPRGNLAFLAESFWAETCGMKVDDLGKTAISGRSGGNSSNIINNIAQNSRTFGSKDTFNVSSMAYNQRQNVGKMGNNHGVCNMVVNSAYLKNKFLKWVELLKDDLVNEKYLVEVPRVE